MLKSNVLGYNIFLNRGLHMESGTRCQKLRRVIVNTRVELEAFARSELNTNLDGIEIDW